MSSEKYIGLDVHQATISVAVMDSQGKVVMESILETKASTIDARGLEGKEMSSPSSRGRKMSLTSPLIDQALALKIPGSGVLSEIGIYQQLSG